MAYGRGHVKGTKREKPGHNEWYKTIEEENIRRIETEWNAQQEKEAQQHQD